MNELDTKKKIINQQLLKIQITQEIFQYPPLATIKAHLKKRSKPFATVITEKQYKAVLTQPSDPHSLGLGERAVSCPFHHSLHETLILFILALKI